MRLVSDKHAHASPGALLVRQPVGGALEDVGAGVDCVAPDGGVVGVGAGVIGLVPVVEGGAVGVGGPAGAPAVGGDVGVGDVCAKLIGAASKHAAAATIKKRFMEELPRKRPRPARDANPPVRTGFPALRLHFSKLARRAVWACVGAAVRDNPVI
jgi:hypothetical protein